MTDSSPAITLKEINKQTKGINRKTIDEEGKLT